MGFIKKYKINKIKKSTTMAFVFVVLGF